MIGYHCNIDIGSWLITQPFFSLFEMTWLVVTGWLPGFTDCLAGGLV